MLLLRLSHRGSPNVAGLITIPRYLPTQVDLDESAVFSDVLGGRHPIGLDFKVVSWLVSATIVFIRY